MRHQVTTFSPAEHSTTTRHQFAAPHIIKREMRGEGLLLFRAGHFFRESIYMHRATIDVNYYD